MSSKEYIVNEHAGERLDVYVCSIFPDITRSHIKNMIDSGNITVNGRVEKSGYKVRLHDKIIVQDIEPKECSIDPENIPIDIIYEDNDCVVINKPQGMCVHPAVGNYSGTLVNALLYNLHDLSGINGVVRPGIVHRIDKDTSGLLIVAKNDNAHVALSRQIATKQCRRIYYALVDGVVKEDSGIIETYIDRDPKNRLKKKVCDSSHGKLAITHFNVLHRYEKYTLMQFELKTGRTHQIRVHCAYMHHPIVGDKLYNPNADKFKLNGQLLHAKTLIFNRVSDNKEITVDCPLPDYFVKVLDDIK